MGVGNDDFLIPAHAYWTTSCTSNSLIEWVNNYNVLVRTPGYKIMCTNIVILRTGLFFRQEHQYRSYAIFFFLFDIGFSSLRYLGDIPHVWNQFYY